MRHERVRSAFYRCLGAQSETVVEKVKRDGWKQTCLSAIQNKREEEEARLR